jgi:hypothetical protein
MEQYIRITRHGSKHQGKFKSHGFLISMDSDMSDSNLRGGELPISY